MVVVEEIDPAGPWVRYRGVQEGRLTCDHLILAAGRSANLNAAPGMGRHALPLKTLGDALALRNRIVRRLEEATLADDDARRRALLTFVVIGGGFSGVETAGQLLDLLRSCRGLYRNVDPADARVVLVHGGPRVLPEIHERLGRYAGERLRHQGVELRLGRRAASVEENGVGLDDGTFLDARTVVSTIGTVAHPFLERSGLPLDRGRVRTDSAFRVEGHAGIWALGDCASVPDAGTRRPSPPTAQCAVRQADRLADNLLRTIRGEPLGEFRYAPIGQFATIGHRNAVAEVGRVRIRGLPAWLLWRAIYVLKVPTLTAKVRIFLEWTWAMLFRRDLGYLDFTPSVLERTPRRGDGAREDAVDGTGVLGGCREDRLRGDGLGRGTHPADADPGLTARTGTEP
jgi:NADH dehydrogenase